MASKYAALCPILALSTRQGSTECRLDRCMWFIESPNVAHSDGKHCAIAVIASSLNERMYTTEGG